MKKSKIIQFDGQEVTVKELTVEQIADCMDAVCEGKVDNLDLLFDGQLPSEAVVRSTGLERGALQTHSPSALELLWKAVEETNPFFLKMVRRMAVTAGKPSGKA
ncbi:hypothetical protein [Syntrophotalea acetylenica]|uniref:hypothetical protein n=1 Tax=Syntrophotalea acetylenica TaxID=29542 RepID=UPI002A35C1B3|nr:hypothetical protein [Syntrophotalea acetylenica]MDY0261978.1 hypothetical protein [Syntrophotalea acetylenica]